MPRQLGLPSSLSGTEISEALNGRCEQERLLRGIRDLLGLYWQPGDSPEERARQALLFVRDLAEFSDDVVTFALREWRRGHDRRPSIASLRQLCMVRRQELTLEAKRRSPAQEAPDPYAILGEDEKLERKAILERVARGAGLSQETTGQWTLPPRKGTIVDTDAPFTHWTKRVDPVDAAEQLRRARLKAGVIS